ncbi:hypothetical protein ACFQL1_22925 [Halomicroarcula sp. GCM10025709]|uniref:hypothetical protein n=1 Tax=Haloarcula TaxID=2237 RepID=UPI0024C43482|nr:hypothetical protein [Halomicroarcula sp. YJ-61-S]
MTDIIDKAAMALSGGLLVLGVVVMGLIETLAGKPFGAAPITNDAGEIVATPMIDPTIRTGLVLAGIAVLGIYAAYKLATPVPEETAASREVTAD